ncbi:MAG: DNA methyltransferase [Candidatus Odinarchaeota archaeon]
MKVSEIVYREDLYPRFKPNPTVIQEYAKNLEQLPPIEVSQNNILIDGYHRWKAYETAKEEEIPYIMTEVKSEQELLMLAVERNSKHGQQLTPDEKKRYAIQWWNVLPDEDICKTLSISRSTFNTWTRNKREEFEEQQKQRIYDMWLACYKQEDIEKVVNMSHGSVNEKIASFVNSNSNGDSDIFRNFESEIYSIWNFGKATNEVRHFGNIPPEIIDNLMYYYTKPFDVVFDPFGGGGSTIDKCIERKRRYYVSDLNPIPARQDIRKHDITTGLPDDLPVPDLVFLDPPYWKQAEMKYSQDNTDLGNVDIDIFLNTIGDIAKSVKRKWNDKHNGKLAIIIGAYKHNGEYIDLPLLCYERISKYLKLKQRIIVPYSTQVHGGAFVKMAKEKKEILYLTRDLMVFER